MNQTSSFTEVEAATAFLDRLEDKDLDRFMELWTDDAVQINPFALDNFPSKYDGKDKIREQYRQLVNQFGRVKFVSRQIQPIQDSNMAIAIFDKNLARIDKTDLRHLSYPTIILESADMKLLFCYF